MGSFARADDPQARLDGFTSFTLFARASQTLPKAERQQIMRRWNIEDSMGFSLDIDPDGHVAAATGQDAHGAFGQADCNGG